MTMMKFSSLFSLALASSLQYTTLADPQHCGSFVHPLTLDGGNTQIGEIVITDSLNPWHQITIDASLALGFDLTPDASDDSAPTWITELHATVCCPSPSPIPCKEATIPYSPGATSVSMTIDEPECGAEFWDHEVVVSVNAKIEKMGGLNAINAVFPVPVGFTLSLDYGDNVGASYFDMMFTGNSPFTGLSLNGYCIDQDHWIMPGVYYPGMAYSFQDTNAFINTNIDRPENLDLVAWAINNYRPGHTYTEASVTPSTYTLTSGTLQRAIWYIIGNTQGHAGLGYFEDDWAQFIANQANGHDGYVPPNGGHIPVVVIPDDNDRQHQIFEATCHNLQVPCEPITVTGSAGAVAQCTPDAPPSMKGDPHLMTWDGHFFEYMGECDLVLLHVPNFGGGEDDLTVHVRTTIRYDYSYIEAAAIQIGEDVLEVGSWGEYSFNDIQSAFIDPTAQDTGLSQGRVQVQPKIGGYTVQHTPPTDHRWKNQRFDIILPHNQNITISSMKDIVSVTIHHASFEYFGKVQGVLGNHHGQMLARDGVTDLSEDINRMAQEWQVNRHVDPVLFASDRSPQYPQQCILPNDAAAMEAREHRRLGVGISEDEAKIACAHVKGNNAVFKACVYDVTITNDLDQAGTY